MASEKQIVETSSPHVQRYFRPLAVRMRFSPERLISPGLHSRRRVFSPEPRGAIPLDVDPYEPKKKKPHGEVTRVGRNGYNLQAALGWTDKFYAEVQVRSTIIATLTTYLIYLVELSIHELARVHLDTRLSFAMQKKDLVKKVFEEV